MGIHNEILELVQSELEAALIDNVSTSDTARAGVVKLGPLQGDPEPDEARISVTLHENDPDIVYKSGTTSQDEWLDEVVEVEIGGSASVTWARRFSVKARVLLDETQEELAEAREIASIVRSRIEHTLMRISFSGTTYDNETVVRGIYAPGISGEMTQAGGPGSYDYHIKVRFDVLTTMNGVVT